LRFDAKPKTPLPREGGLLRERLIDPVVGLLKRGTSPGRVSLSLAVGATIGLFPLVGTTTAMNLVAALLFRLNLVANQAGNWLVYPLQILLVIPFMKLGALFLGSAGPTFDLAELKEIFGSGIAPALEQLGGLALAAVLAWTLVSPAIAGLLFLLSYPLVKRLAKRSRLKG
jgi:uncharacterized protein (DUF2062 family)